MSKTTSQPPPNPLNSGVPVDVLVRGLERVFPSVKQSDRKDLPDRRGGKPFLLRRNRGAK